MNAKKKRLEERRHSEAAEKAKKTTPGQAHMQTRLRNKLDLKCKLQLVHKGLTELLVTVSQIHLTELAS